MIYQQEKSLKQKANGFTMIELILSLALSGILILTMTMVIGNFFSTFPLVGDYDGDSNERTPISPAYQMTPNAIALQEQISSLLSSQNISAVYVLGGKDESGMGVSFDSDTQENALHTTGEDTAELTIPELQKPSNLLNCSMSFRKLLLNSTSHNSFSTATAHENDFTIFFIENQTEVAAIIKSRRSDADGFVQFDLTYQDNLSSTTDSQYCYSFKIEKTKYNHFSEKVGVKHIWLRSLPNWSINEELGSVVIFPDPAATPNTTAQGEHNFPNYCLFLPTKL